MGRYDLHSHTTCSDGRLSPTELVEVAAKAGLAGIAVTDHDTTAGVAEAMEAGERLGVEIIPGVEMTSEELAFECHILGYFVNHQEGPFQELLGRTRNARVIRAREMLRRLRLMDLDVSEAEVVQLHGPGAVGRPHIASLLVEKGYALTVRRAMRRFLSKRSPAYVPRMKLSPEEVVSAIAQGGGAPVFAHPGLMGMDPTIERLAGQGLAGIEVYYPEHSDSDVERYAAMAARLGLVATGGSDFHGLETSRASSLGDRFVEKSTLEELKKRRGLQESDQLEA